MPSFVTKSRPKNARPVTEIATVRPAKMHRPTRRRARLGRGVARRQTLVEVLAEPRDDEERVVDADADPDHRHEDGRDRVDVGQPGEDEEQDERRRDGDERERDRDRGRDERAEDDQQDDERREEAEQLLRALLDRRELGVAVELGGDARRLDRRRERRPARRRPAIAVLRLDDVRRTAPPRRRSDRRRRTCSRWRTGRRRSRSRPGPCRLELGRLELAIALLDRGLALGRVEPLALGSREDEVEHASPARTRTPTR